MMMLIGNHRLHTGVQLCWSQAATIRPFSQRYGASETLIDLGRHRLQRRLQIGISHGFSGDVDEGSDGAAWLGGSCTCRTAPGGIIRARATPAKRPPTWAPLATCTLNISRTKGSITRDTPAST